jgi:hypothetical protein
VGGLCWACERGAPVNANSRAAHPPLHEIRRGFKIQLERGTPARTKKSENQEMVCDAPVLLLPAGYARSADFANPVRRRKPASIKKPKPEPKSNRLEGSGTTELSCSCIVTGRYSNAGS